MNDDYVDENGVTQFRNKCVEMTKEELKGIYPELYKLSSPQTLSHSAGEFLPQFPFQ